MKKIIAFGHRKETGKDTCAKYLITELKLRHPGINIQKHGFADKVKDVAQQIYSWADLKSGEYYERPENLHLKEVILPKLGKTPRQIWIGCGNGIRNAVGYDGTWLDYLFHNVKYDVLVIKDLRFPAEADGVLNAGGLLCKIHCPWSPVVNDNADDPLENYDKWGEHIANDQRGNFQNLHRQVMVLLEKYFNGP